MGRFRSKEKGTKAETEFAALAVAHGIPCCRTIGSGAIKDAEGDNKLGMEMTSQGVAGGRDDAAAAFRVEVKNLKNSNLDWVYDQFDQLPAYVIGTERVPAATVGQALEQSDMATILAMRRQKAPAGALKNMEANELFICAMRAGDFFALIRENLMLKEMLARKDNG